MPLRPSVPVAASVAALLLCTAAPALAQEAPQPAVGEAVSGLTLLSATVGSTSLVAGGVELVAGTTGAAPAAEVVVTPLVVDGTAHGRTVVPAGERRTVPAVSTGAVAAPLAGLVDVTGPAVEAGASVADGAARAAAGSSSLGAVSVLGLPVRASGDVVSAAVTDATAASATRTLELRDVALPSVADLLGALGLDLSRLPVEVLRELVTELELLTPAVTSAADALDAAAAAVDARLDAAQAEVDRQVAAVTAAQRQLTAATGALPGLTAAAQERAAAAEAARAAAAAAEARRAEAEAAVAALLPGAAVPAALSEAVRTATADAVAAAAAVTRAESAAAAADAALQAGRTAVTAAQAALDEAQRLLAAARALLAGLLRDLQPQVDALVAAVTAVLDDTPLVRLDGLTVATAAGARGAGEGEQSAEVVGGEVRGLQVLGTDVLRDVLGRSSVELTGDVDAVLGRVGAAVDALTGTLSEVLSTVPSLPALDVPAPQVDLLVSDASTGVDDDFGTASTAVTGLRVTLPAVTLPVEVALPSAASLPGVSVLPTATLPAGLAALTAAPLPAGLTAGDLLTSSATTLGFGTLTEAVRFRAASGDAAVVVEPPAPGDPAGTPVVEPLEEPALTPVPVAAPGSLPRTGASDALALVALGLVGTAAWLRRRAVAG